METTWITLLNEIMQTVVVPLMGILTVFLIKVIREKMDAAAKNTKNETLAKYILMLKETVVDCVLDSSKQDYRAIHLYFKKDNYSFPWELQIWNECDSERNLISHKKYKQEYTAWEKKNKKGGTLDD